MKNLRVFQTIDKHFELNIVGHCIDADNGTLYILTDDFEILKTSTSGFQLDYEKVEIDFVKDSSIFKDKIRAEDVKFVEFTVELGSILIALKIGHLLRIGVTSFSAPSQYLYKHFNEITSVKLSPEQDLIALADDKNNIYIMTLDGKICYDSNALNQNDSLHKPVGVGWGSKETQFFGLDGRPSKEKQAKDQIILSDEQVLSIQQIESSQTFKEFRERQKSNTVIDWRGDGQFLATLTYLPDDDKHYLKVWNRILELQYMSEQLVTIERGILSWVPNGQYVCCAQRRDNNINDIALFEKNGMVHQRITLPIIMEHIYTKSFSWSPDSKVFATIVHQFDSSNESISYTPILMLYTMQNFHYYLKFTYKLDRNNEYQLRWDPIHQNRLHILSSFGHYIEFNCSFEVTFSNQHSTVAVVDGNKIRLTPLSICNIPPPMSAITIELTANIIHKLIMDSTKASNLFILTLDNEIIRTSVGKNLLNAKYAIIKIDLENMMAKSIYDDLSETYQICHLEDCQKYQNFTIIDQNNLLATCFTPAGTQLVQITLVDEDNSTRIEILHTFENKLVVYLTQSYQYLQKTVVMLNDGSSIVFDHKTKKMSTICKQVATAGSKSLVDYFKVETVIHPTQPIPIQPGFISLNQNLTLSHNNIVIANNCCTSFRTTKNFLLFTNTDNTLHFICLSSLCSPYTIPEAERLDSWAQPIEAGGTLIIVSEDDSKVVLQMPRGNLEILHPRVLIISSLATLLDQKRWVDSVKLSRRHRLNMNIICDYMLYKYRSLNEFNQSLNEFALDIVRANSDLLLTFITEMEDVNTIADRYKAILTHIPQRSKFIDQSMVEELFVDKTNNICSNILLSLSSISTQDTLKCELLCLLKMKPKKINEALKMVMDLPKESRPEALKYILYFIDIDQLFEEALGTYDTNITLMVAGASHKDPKEYLALLNKFDTIENENWRCFEIDTHLKRYTKAFDHLLSLLLLSLKSNDEVDCSRVVNKILDLVCDSRLYKHAIIKLYQEDGISGLKEIIWAKYAQYLYEKRYFLESGLAYSKAFNYSPNETYLIHGMNSYYYTDNWEAPLAQFTRNPLADDKITKSCLKKIEDRLISHTEYYKFAKAFRDCTTIEIDSEYARALHFHNRWHLAEYYTTIGQPDLRSKYISDIVPTLIQRITDLKCKLEVGFHEVKQHFTRLQYLLNTYQSRKLNEMNEENYIPDTLSTVDGSEVSSMTSGSNVVKRTGVLSIKTRHTSKSNKSHAVKQKRITLKEGSRNEDLALILEIQKYISNLAEAHTESQELALVLYDYCAYESAGSIIKELNEIMTNCYNFSKEISELLWPTMPQHEQKYSLYRRFSNLLADLDGSYDNNDFVVLVKPIMNFDSTCFEL